LKEQSYSTETTPGLCVTSPKFSPLTLPGHTFNLGTCSIKRSIVHKAKILDLSPFMIPVVFSQPGNNLLEQVSNFFQDKWDYLRSHDMFILPINLPLKQKGLKKVDLPTVDFIVTFLMLEHSVEFVVVDPIYNGTDSTVRIINFSEAYRDLLVKRKKVQTAFSPADGLSTIFYQRGAGAPDEKTYMAMTSVTGIDKSKIMHCRLTPGKYEQGFWNSGNCYKDFKESVAKLLDQLSMLDPYTIALGKHSISKLYFVLDEFSAYAAYTAVAILGYGIKEVSSVLAYRQGVYTAIKL